MQVLLANPDALPRPVGIAQNRPEVTAIESAEACEKWKETLEGHR